MESPIRPSLPPPLPSLLSLLSDDPLMEALKFFARRELYALQRVNRQMAHFIGSETFIGCGPRHLVREMVIGLLDGRVARSLTGSTPWGDNNQQESEEDGWVNSFVSGVGEVWRSQLSASRRRVRRLASSLFPRFISRPRRQREHNQEPLVTLSAEEMEWEKLDKLRQESFLSSLANECPLPISALKLTLYAAFDADGKVTHLWPRNCHMSVRGSNSDLKLSCLSDPRVKFSFLLSEACLHPMPGYVRIDKMAFRLLGHEHHPLAGALRDWLYNSRGAFIDTELHLDVDAYPCAPWLLEKVFTRVSSLTTTSFGRLSKMPSSLMSAHCHQLSVCLVGATTGNKIFNVESLVEWLHHPGGGKSSDDGGGEAVKLLLSRHLLVQTDHNNLPIVLELVGRVKKIFEEANTIDYYKNPRPSFIISIVTSKEDVPKGRIAAPFELRNKAAGEKLVGNTTDSLARPSQQICRVQRCRWTAGQHAQEEERNVRKTLGPARPNQYLENYLEKYASTSSSS